MENYHITLSLILVLNSSVKSEFFPALIFFSRRPDNRLLWQYRQLTSHWLLFRKVDIVNKRRSYTYSKAFKLNSATATDWCVFYSINEFFRSIRKILFQTLKCYSSFSVKMNFHRKWWNFDMKLLNYFFYSKTRTTSRVFRGWKYAAI